MYNDHMNNELKNLLIFNISCKIITYRIFNKITLLSERRHYFPHRNAVQTNYTIVSNDKIAPKRFSFVTFY